MCFGTPDDDDDQMEWTSPCRCCGGTKWVHQSCLQQWIDEKQRMSSSIAVSCPQCQFTYRIQYPSSNIILYLYDQIERGISLASPMILAGITATTLYWASFTYGITATTLAMGREQAVDYFKSPDSTLTIVCLPIVPWVIVGLKIIRPEVLILRFCYRFVLPLVSKLLKHFPLTSQLSLPRRQRFYPAEIQPLPYISRCILSMAMLPFVSSALGNLIFRFTNSGVKRTLMVNVV